MNAEQEALIAEIKASLPLIEEMDREGEGLGTADDILELLVEIERYLRRSDARN